MGAVRPGRTGAARRPPQRARRPAAGEHAAAFARTRDELHAALAGDGAFAGVVANARLGVAEAEVLAVAAAAETDPAAQRMLAGLQRDAVPARVAFGTLCELFPDVAVAAFGLGTDGALRRAALADVEAAGPWLDQRVGVHPTVLWSLLGDPGSDPDLTHDPRHQLSAAAGAASLAVVTRADPARRRQQTADALYGEAFLVTALPDSDAGWAAVVREATITGHGVIVELDDTLPAAGRRWIERAEHLVWGLACQRDVAIAELPRRPWIALHVADTAVAPRSPTSTPAGWPSSSS